MGILTSVLGQGRFALYGLAAAGLLILGWTVSGWRNDSLKLDDAKEAIRTAQARMAQAQRDAIKADEDRVTMGVKLTDAEEALRSNSTQAKVIIRRVVQSDSRCNLEPSVIRVLAAARRGGEQMPATPDPTPNAGGTTKAAPR